MKFIKNGVIYEPHSEFVIAQMQKAGYTPYNEEETKEEKAVEETKEAVKETKEKKKKK